MKKQSLFNWARIIFKQAGNLKSAKGVMISKSGARGLSYVHLI